MLNNTTCKNNNEISKLIEFGYDLHERGIDWYEHSVPSFEFYNGNCCSIKKVDGGGIFGKRGYPNHSESRVFTILGVTVGKNEDEDFELDYAFMMQTDNKYRRIFFSNLKISEKSENWYKTLDYDRQNEWEHMSYEEKQKLFIKAMEFIGYKKEDIIAVLNGELTAREAYMNAAPEELKHLQWVSKSRRMFVFDKNVAVEGNFGSMDMDSFPFPFDEQPILDCSKVKTSSVHFENNKRKVKLINVNSNPESISYTDLKNAIIDEPIDLSLVDATGTKFGHHKVINLEWSKAKLKNMDLTFATNENGERYVVDNNGVVQFDYDCGPKTIKTIENEENNIYVFSNADNSEMVNFSIENDTDGIGLVRTEHIFDNENDLNQLIRIIEQYTNGREERLKRIKELQINQAREISRINKPVVFRLLDFKIKECLKNFNLSLSADYDEEYMESLRGTGVFSEQKDILINQVEAIFEVLEEKNMDVNLLIPMIETSAEIYHIKKQIKKLAEKYNLKSLKVGAMIENIGACSEVDEIVEDADFISIGTNDLTESITGLSRDTNSIEFQILTDEVKAAIEEVIYRVRAIKPNIIIGICGEHANYIENLEFYKRLDINYITCSPDFVKVNKDFLTNNTNIGSAKSKTLKRTTNTKN